MTLTELTHEQWLANLETTPGWRNCIFLSPKYFDCWARHEQARPMCLFAEDKNTSYLYPFFLRRISAPSVGREARYAIHSAYGYGGLVRTPRAAVAGCCSSERMNGLRRVNQAIDDWCARHGIVSEFVREQHLLPDSARLREMAYSVARYDLFALLEENDWRALLPSHARRPFNRAREQGFTSDVVPLANGLHEFHALYIETMTRVAAAPYYFFPRSYLISLAGSFNEAASLIRVRAPDGALAAAGLVLTSGPTAIFHLAASAAGHIHSGVNDFLYVAVLSWAERSGFAQVLLGGGMSPTTEDSLYRFKRKFATRGQPFHVGKKIHDPVAHGQFRDGWLRANPKKAATMKDILQCYLY